MGLTKNKFSDLFRKYRLRAEFKTLSELGLALSEKGLLYEESIFSHWQKGTRIPQNRPALIKLIEVFIDRGAITKQLEANEFLASANQGYLSEEELNHLSLRPQNSVFQVPGNIDNFSNREDVISYLSDKNNIRGNVILLHGGAGVGKTALAIKLGHILRSRFNDGVLWYKIEEDNISDILLSIARVYGEDISGISDVGVRSTVVRSILSSKDALLFLDNSELSDDIHLLIPNSKFCTTIITSKESHLSIQIPYRQFAIGSFNDAESLNLFKNVLGEQYVSSNKENLLRIARKVAHLPLSLHLISRQLMDNSMTTSRMINLLEQSSSVLEGMFYENKTLKAAVALSYKKLDEKSKSVLVSSSIFKGKDFSVNSIAYINGLSIETIINILNRLIDLSLVEKSTRNRYRIHPVIREFLREKLDNPKSFNLTIIATLLFVSFFSWWIIIQLFLEKNSIYHHLFSSSYGIVSLYGGICGINTSLRWGGVKTVFGRSILVFSFGLIFQFFGQISYSYYSNFLGISIPYPSIGDLWYFGTIPIYIYGIILLANASGIKLNVRSYRRNILSIVLPTSLLIISYFLFFQNYELDISNPIKTFLDFGYPFGETIYISLALVTFILSRNILDGIMHSKALLVLVALVIQFFADYIFLYNSSSFYPGSYIDLIYLISYFMMTYALLSLRSLQVTIKN